MLWNAYVVSGSRYWHRRMRWSRSFASLWRAQLAVRAAAVRVDWATPVDPDGEIGVHWYIEPGDDEARAALASARGEG